MCSKNNKQNKLCTIWWVQHGDIESLTDLWRKMANANGSQFAIGSKYQHTSSQCRNQDFPDVAPFCCVSKYCLSRYAIRFRASSWSGPNLGHDHLPLPQESLRDPGDGPGAAEGRAEGGDVQGPQLSARSGPLAISLKLVRRWKWYELHLHYDKLYVYR